jgi:N-acetyl-D-muramate 6-phosphate phosphatase
MPGADRASATRLAVRAVLFDLDGTLADTAEDLAAALNRLRADRSLDPMPLTALRPHASHGARGLLGAGFSIGVDHPEYAMMRDAFLTYYEAALSRHTRVFEGAERVLEEITHRGLRWGIVTNKASRFTLPLLKQLAFASGAGAVICGDTTPHSKPHPAPLLAAAAALDVAPSACVYVGDAERDVEAGRAAGMKTLVAAYGYIHEEDVPERWLPDGFIASLAELLDWLPLAVAPGATPPGEPKTR